MEGYQKKTDEDIGDLISGDFSAFVEGVNVNLPESRQVTRWSAQYQGDRAFITVTHLGREPYCDERGDSRHTSLPPYLGYVKEFGKNYSFPVFIEMFSHVDLDVPLDELK